MSLIKTIWDDNPKEAIDNDEMEAISSMFEDHDMVCEEKSTQDYLIWEVEDVGNYNALLCNISL